MKIIVAQDDGTVIDTHTLDADAAMSLLCLRGSTTTITPANERNVNAWCAASENDEDDKTNPVNRALDVWDAVETALIQECEHLQR